MSKVEISLPGVFLIVSDCIVSSLKFHVSWSCCAVLLMEGTLFLLVNQSVALFYVMHYRFSIHNFALGPHSYPYQRKQKTRTDNTDQIVDDDACQPYKSKFKDR